MTVTVANETGRATKALSTLVTLRKRINKLDAELARSRAQQKDLYEEAFKAGVSPVEMARAMQPSDWHYLAETIRQELKRRGYKPNRKPAS